MHMIIKSVQKYILFIQTMIFWMMSTILSTWKSVPLYILTVQCLKLLAGHHGDQLSLNVHV